LHFILGSSSPRRKELLESIGITPDAIISPNIDENSFKKERPKTCAERLAKAKSLKIQKEYPNSLILTADTIVFCGRRIIDKTEDIKVARNYLELLSGRRHRVISSIFITNGITNISKSVQTLINFKSLTNSEISNYLDSDDWINIAGAYKIQGAAASFVKSINGSYTNAIGLPLYEVKNMLSSIGYLD
jgi:septum formation protein